MQCLPLHAQDALESTSKQDIHSVKVLGEGAFGIVDLVLVDQQGMYDHHEHV